MSLEDFMELAALIVLIILPALAITARLSLKPMVEAILRLRESFGAEHPTRDLSDRVSQLEHEMRTLNGEVARLGEVEAFYRRLEDADPGRRLPTPPAAPHDGSALPSGS